jgi:hypothetical protein
MPVIPCEEFSWTDVSLDETRRFTALERTMAIQIHMMFNILTTDENVSVPTLLPYYCEVWDDMRAGRNVDDVIAATCLDMMINSRSNESIELFPAYMDVYKMIREGGWN